MQEFGPCTVDSCHRVSSGYASSGVPCLRSWRTFVFVVILFPVYSFALNSSVIGTVSDPTGRPIADASVELVDANGALRVKAVSGSAGKFQLAAPALSECTLIVKAAGFQTVSKRLVNSPEEKAVPSHLQPCHSCDRVGHRHRRCESRRSVFSRSC